MLVKHSALYFFARGLPGVVNFLAIAIYTRLLSTAHYGRYALVVAGVDLFNVVFFQWIRLSLLRFLPAHLEDPHLLKETLLASFLWLVLGTGILGVTFAFAWPNTSWRNFILLAIPLLWAQAWFEVNLEIVRSNLKPLRYGLMCGLRATFALCFGAIMVLLGSGSYGPLAGLLLGAIIAGVIFSWKEWIIIKPKISKAMFPELLHYGLPLTAAFALSFIVRSSDRFLIALLISETAAGQYSAVYDLAQQPLGVLMAVVSLAGYPLVVRALEKDGVTAAEKQLKRNSCLLFMVALPATLGMILLASNITGVVLGEEFRNDAPVLLQWVSVAIIFSGLRSYHFDLAFQLGKYTLGQMGVVGLAAVVNIALNIWWIPKWGILGAAYATFISYILALIASVVIGRKIFKIVVAWKDLYKVGVSCCFLALFLCVTTDFKGVWPLVIRIFTGLGVYITGVAVLNIGGFRTLFVQELKK
mgnify:CR=1 FL=1